MAAGNVKVEFSQENIRAIKDLTKAIEKMTRLNETFNSNIVALANLIKEKNHADQDSDDTEAGNG